MLLEVGHHAHDERLLLVMELDGLPLGLLIDGVTAIVRRRPAEVMPLPSFGVARPALYVGMLPDCGDGGPGDALLLNHEALARHEQVGPLLRLHAARHDTATSEASATASLAPGRTRQTFLTYSAGSSLSSPLAHIREIITYPNSLVRLGTQDGPMAGMLNRGGMMTPLVDLRRLLGQDKRDWSVRPKVLIVQDGNTNFGFIVDTVDAIVFVKPDEEMICTDRVVILPNGHPALAQLLRLAMIEGSVQRRTMTLLDLAGLARTLQQEAVSAGQTSALPMLSKTARG